MFGGPLENRSPADPGVQYSLPEGRAIGLQIIPEGFRRARIHRAILLQNLVRFGFSHGDLSAQCSGLALGGLSISHRVFSPSSLCPPRSVVMSTVVLAIIDTNNSAGLG